MVFAAEEQNQIVALLVGSSGAGIFDFYGQPARFELSSNLSPEQVVEVERNFAAKIRKTYRDYQVRLQVQARREGTGPLLESILESGARASTYFEAQHVLGNTYEESFGKLRKSYRQLLRSEVVEELRVDLFRGAKSEEGWLRYRNLHRQVAGRITRGNESWNSFLEMLIEGSALLVLVSLGEKLVGGATFFTGNGSMLYASGAYDRALFGRYPLGHVSLNSALEWGLDNQMSILQLGEVFSQTTDEKLRAIARFKKGFATKILTTLVLERPPL